MLPFLPQWLGSITEYDGHPALHEFSHQYWQPFDVTTGEVVFERHILPVDEANCLEALFERRYVRCGTAGFYP